MKKQNTKQNQTTNIKGYKSNVTMSEYLTNRIAEAKEEKDFSRAEMLTDFLNKVNKRSAKQ